MLDFGFQFAKRNVPLRSLLILAYILHEQHFLLDLEDPMSENCLFVVDCDVIVLSESSVNLTGAYLDLVSRVENMSSVL